MTVILRPITVAGSRTCLMYSTGLELRDPPAQSTLDQPMTTQSKTVSFTFVLHKAEIFLWFSFFSSFYYNYCIAKKIITLKLYFNCPPPPKKMKFENENSAILLCLQHKAGTCSLRVLVLDASMTVLDWCLLMSQPTNSTVCSSTITCMEPTSIASMSTSRSGLSLIVTYHNNNMHF